MTRLQQAAAGLFITLFFVFSATAPVQAQTGGIAGLVTDAETQTPLPGVNVVIEGTQRGVATNAEGRYEISDLSPGDYTIVASFVGYSEQSKDVTVEAGETATLDFALQSSAMQMDEVVAVGYGEQQRRDVTGSVSSVSGSDLQEVSNTSIDLGLQGLSAGVYVQRGRTKPGDNAAQVRIRGNRSISAGNDPLYVVDGVPLTGGLGDINPQNVESIEVLKDASATAIYGARGANGVIIVTTQRGYEGQMSVSYNGYASMKMPYRQVDVFNGAEFAEYKRESRRTTGDYPEGVSAEADEQLFEPVELESIQQGRSTDWQDLLTERGSEQNHHISVAGGDQDIRFNVSFGALLDDGIIPQQEYQRYTTRVNIDATVNDWLQVGTSTLGSYSVQNHADENPFFDSVQNNPLGPAFCSQSELRECQDGELIFLPTSDGLNTNPLYDVKEGAIIDEEKRYRLLSSLFADVSLLDGLSYRFSFSPDLVQRREGNFAASLTNEQRFGPPDGSKNEDFVLNYTLDNQVNYSSTFADVHELNATGLFSYQQRQEEYSFVGVRGIPVEAMEDENFGAAEVIEGADSNFEEWSLVSYMGRLNYIYDDRYLVTATARLDGSSRFGENNRFGFFPSFALAWNVDNESFMADSELFDALRVRFSWGQSGNTAIDPYQTLGLLDRTTYAFGSNAGFGYRPGQLSNADLKWETTSTYNLGVEFEVLNSRIAGSVDAYVANTTDLLLERQIPFTSGFGSVLENVGATRNSGIEFSVTSVNIDSQDPNGFRWTTNLNMAYNNEEIVELFSGKEDDVGNEWFIGEPVQVYYDYERLGIWQQDEAAEADAFGQNPGEVRVKDQNGDGSISGADRVILGQEQPKVTAGLNTQFSYQGWNLSVFLVGRFGSMIDSAPHTSMNTLFGRYNNLDVDYWTPDNTDARYPRPNQNQEFPIYGSTLGYFSGDFVKVRSATLSYSLPSSILDRVNAQTLRLYVTAEQPFIFSSYVQNHNGIDPEYPELNTPTTRSFRLGLNLTL
jgi:TonB-linked SusC/RagA family outer membrane protein